MYPLAFVAERLVGVAAKVVNLTPPGVEPHDLEVTPNQAAVIEDARVVLLIGQGLQPSVEDASSRRNSGVISVLDAIGIDGTSKHDEEINSTRTDPTRTDPTRTDPTRTNLSHPDNLIDGLTDPHVWLDPKLMQSVVATIADALKTSFPDSTENITNRATKLNAELDKIDKAYRVGLAGCKGRMLVTSHAAFGRLAARYGLVEEAIVGLSPEAEPTADRLATLADLIKRNGITTIFAEVLGSKKIAESLARESGTFVAILDPLEGAPTTGDYIASMGQNLAILRSGLHC